MTVWISVAEAATRLSCTRLTVYNMLTRKKLKGTKLGGFQLVDAASVEKQRKERARARR
jgi:excisionase family DNA binding protein